MTAYRAPSLFTRGRKGAGSSRMLKRASSPRSSSTAWIGRSLLVIVDAHDRLQAFGVALKSATEPIDTSNPSGRLIFQMLASFAEYERETTIRERTRAGLHRAFRGGRHFGAVPYGYRADDRGFLQVVPEEAKIVREIVSNVAEGSTLYAEAKRLNDLGLATPG